MVNHSHGTLRDRGGSQSLRQGGSLVIETTYKGSVKYTPHGPLARVKQDTPFGVYPTGATIDVAGILTVKDIVVTIGHSHYLSFNTALPSLIRAHNNAPI